MRLDNVSCLTFLSSWPCSWSLFSSFLPYLFTFLVPFIDSVALLFMFSFSFSGVIVWTRCLVLVNGQYIGSFVTFLVLNLVYALPGCLLIALWKVGSPHFDTFFLTIPSPFWPHATLFRSYSEFYCILRIFDRKKRVEVVQKWSWMKMLTEYCLDVKAGNESLLLSFLCLLFPFSCLWFLNIRPTILWSVSASPCHIFLLVSSLFFVFLSHFSLCLLFSLGLQVPVCPRSVACWMACVCDKQPTWRLC